MPEITITSKRDGFRRCGVAHRDVPVTWPDGQFTAAEIAILKSEPQLVVHEGGIVRDDVQSDLQLARSRIIDLEATIDQLRTTGQGERDQAQARITELEATNADLLEKLTAASQTASDLTAERDRLLAAAADKAQDSSSSSESEEPSSKGKK
ncbi:hypothetical protein TUM17576_40260 [Enterobacter hormaechei]|nr:HI1506-related protein [Enterobacter hormaechei]GJL37206.1 hypothetical protein TUM17576_40260 [Enterobacter hormaechei]